MSRTTVEEIKARIPIEELIGSYVKMEKAGKSYKARCPFHNEKTASFFISPDRGGYYCFGCGVKGDIFSFVEQFEGLDFRGALKVLAEKAGVPLVVDQKADSEKDRLFKITELAAKFFEDQFERSNEAKDYIKSRGINPETRVAFRIGWAPEGWSNLFTYLKGKGWTETVIEKAGLIKRRDIEARPLNKEQKSNFSSAYDRFRGRIIFPITDSSGRVVAFTGRILKDDGKSAKYLNSPDTPLFNKSQILFGLDKAKTEIRRVGYSILVEGQMDLVLSHQVGVKNAIAASGTALTDQSQDETGVVSNLGMVRRLSSNMIIALDSDKAGRAAAMRAVAATALSMGMSVKIADIEGGKDPADIILQDPENWKNALKNAKHVVEFELGNVLRDVADKHKLSQAVRERVFPFLIKIDSEMDKAYYIKIIAEKVGLAESAVWDDMRKVSNAKPQVVNNRNTTSNSNSSLVGNSQNSNSQKPPANNQRPIINNQLPVTNRIDLVERRMFGLLTLMESSNLSLAMDYREKIKKIAGDSYEERIKRIEPILNDISFEAEAFFGHEQDKWNMHMNELILNFEEDLIGEELMKTMSELRIAEKAGDSARVAEMAKKCQVLSIKKAETSKRRS
ncbi:MAG: DNA primase [Candidatus Paceibacterota bacterium]|jgi:DNA primase